MVFFFLFFFTEGLSSHLKLKKIFFLFVVDFGIHLNETAIPPPDPPSHLPDPIDVIGTVIGFFTKSTQLPRGELEGGIGCQRQKRG